MIVTGALILSLADSFSVDHLLLDAGGDFFNRTMRTLCLHLDLNFLDFLGTVFAHASHRTRNKDQTRKVET